MERVNELRKRRDDILTHAERLSQDDDMYSVIAEYLWRADRLKAWSERAENDPDRDTLWTQLRASEHHLCRKLAAMIVKLA